MNNEGCGEQKNSLSRRGFLSGVGALAVGTAAVTALPKMAYAKESDVSEDAVELGEVKIFDGMELSVGRIVHDPDVCAGCRVCEIVCSLSKWGMVDPALSSIRIRTDVLGGYVSEAEVCKQCPGPECVAVCPTQACVIDPTTGARVIDASLCVGCQVCLTACPVTPSRVHYNAAKNVCVKCDLCGGEPQCVAHCPAGALSASWIEVEDDGSIVMTNAGIIVNVVLTGSIIVIAPDSISLANIDAEIRDGVVVSGDITSTYTQPFEAKIKIAYFAASGETLFFSERLVVDVDPGATAHFEDIFEISSPEEVASCNLEIMCGKIAG